MKRLGSYLGLTLALILGALALTSTAARVVLLTLDDVHPYLSRWLSESLDVRIDVDHAVSEWRGVYPSVILHGVTLRFDGTEVAHRFDRMSFNLDLLESLFSLSLIPERISVVGGAIRLQRLEDGNWALEGMPEKTAESAWSLPVDDIWLRDVRIDLLDRKTGDRVDLGAVDMDVSVGLLGVVARARNRVPSSGDLDFELQVEFDTAGAGKGVLRVDRMRWVQLMAWLPNDARRWVEFLPEDIRARAEARLEWDDLAPRFAGVRMELERPKSEGAEWEKLSGALNWRALREGHMISLSRLELDQRVVAEGARLEHQGEAMRGGLVSLDIALAKRLAAIAGHGLESLPFGGITSGKVYRLSGEVHLQDQPTYWAHAEVTGLGLSIPEKGGSLSGLDGAVSVSERGFRLDLDSENVEISYAPWNLDAVRPGRSRLRLDVWTGEDCCAFRAKDIQVSNPAFRLHGAVWMGSGKSPRLRADMKIERADLPVVSRWFPSGFLSDADDRWVRSAFKAGSLIDARLRLDAPLSDETPASPGPEFTLEGALREVDLDYEPGLPMFREIEGTVLLDKQSLHAIIHQASIQNSSVRHAALRMDDLGLMDMHMSSVLEGPVSDVPEFLESIEWMSPAFNQALLLKGRSTLDLQLNLPLDQRLDHEAKVKGVMRLHDDRMDILAINSHLDEINGELRYQDERLAGSLEARFSGHPARVDLATTRSGDFQVKIQALASLQDYLPREARPTFSWLRGRSAWDLTLLLPGATERSTRDYLTVFGKSDFRGTEVDLPDPLGKTKKEARRLEVRADIDLDGRADLSLEYADLARARLRVNPESAVSGAIGLGLDEAPAHSDSKLVLTGSMSKVNARDWIDWKKRYAGQEGVWPEISGLRADRLEAFGLDVEDAELSVRFTEEKDQFAINAPAIRGILDLPKEDGKPIRGAFDWLRLSTRQLETMEDAGETDLAPQDLPPLDMEFRLLHVGPYEFRDARLVTSPGERRVNIDGLQAKSHKFHMDLSGHWSLENGRHLTLLRGAVHTDDLHETLKHWSVDNPLREGVIDVDLALQWAGAPHEYEFKKLQGYIDIKGKDGRIRNVAPEFARILALLNLEMIFERLSLEFDDVVRGGFTYQTVDGKFDFLQGNLSTSEFRIIGPSAQFLIGGHIGVENEDYDLTVVATPETSALLPAFGALGGPVGIAGAYIGTKVLDWLGFGINQATAVTYQVTGSWSNPIIQEITPAKQESK